MNNSDISVIVPVKDNQSGINRLLESFCHSQLVNPSPREIIIIDNGSKPAISIPAEYLASRLPVKLLHCNQPGPGAARNKGVEHAAGDWLLFIDSDCLPSSTLLSGYTQAPTGAVAYAGFIDALAGDTLSNYYVSQNIHLPPKLIDVEGQCSPKYLVTANALVCKTAFNRVSGFNQAFTFAGGEDIDLALRLKQIGRIEFALGSVVIHDFDDGLTGFVKRFIRYGKGIGLVKALHSGYQFPAPFTANKKLVFANNLLVILQWFCMYFGYVKMKRELKKTNDV